MFLPLRQKPEEKNSLAFLYELKYSTERNLGDQGQRRMTSGFVFLGSGGTQVPASLSTHLYRQFFGSKGKLYLTFKSRDE